MARLSSPGPGRSGAAPGSLGAGLARVSPLQLGPLVAPCADPVSAQPAPLCTGRSPGSLGRHLAAAAVPESPGSRKLWQTLLFVLFLVRVSVRNKVTASLSQLGRMVQRHVDYIFHKYHGAISRGPWRRRSQLVLS